nr:protein translocase subunit SecD [Planctomycetota bacterium]
MSFDFKWPALLALFVVAPCVVASEQKDIVIADFEGKDYGDWKVEGEAFGTGPAPSTLPDQTEEVKKLLGKGLVNSGDETTGTLTSPKFTIDRDFVNLLVGGGGYKDKTYVSLLVNGQRVKTAMGPNTETGGSEALSWVTWDVTDLAGKEAVIQIVDDHTGDGGHINVDQIVLSDTQMADQPWLSALWSAFLAFPWWTLLRLFIALPLPWYLGHRLAVYLRMKDYSWKLGVIFCALASAGVIVQAGTLPLGVDLEGGDILVYEVDRETLKEQGTQALTQGVRNRLIEAISNRINPSGTKEIIVRQYGDWQIEIIIPKVDRREVEQIKKLISTAGSLEFRIVAKRNHAPHEYVINLAETQAQDPNKRRSKNVRDTEGTIVGYWARVDREEGEAGKLGELRVDVRGDVIRNATTGKPVSLNEVDLDSVEIDVLMVVDEDTRFHVKGEHLGMVSRGYDETMRPCVRFNMRGQGAGLMGALTGSNLPDEQRDFYQRMAILLDGSVLSAPRIITTISDRGQITGSFTVEEVDFLVGVLHSGSLPAAVNEEPISENQIGAVLGEDTIQRGKWAIGISLGAVLVFVLFWYRYAGIVACLALAANLLLILALMMSFNAAMTLPGLAGLVLTVGMSVDANVLIFERLREELDRGAALRMAIRNGFSRATTTIVDANLTTLITALVLYAIGTDQIRGFAVTLILGILMSMFTAIFCARVVFDLFERKRRLKSLKMRRMVGDTHIDFIGRRTIAAVVSTLLIIVGLVAVGVRGAQIFDIDFAGGTSVTMVLEPDFSGGTSVRMVLEPPTSEAGIRSKLDQKFAGLTFEGSSVKYSVNRVDDAGQADNTVWKIDSSIPDVEQLQEILKSAFPV